MEMKTSSIHLLVIWSKALQHQKAIEKDILESFECLKKIQVQRDRSLYKANYRCFYAYSLKDNTPKEVDSILKQKINGCGNGPFWVYIIKDDDPKPQKSEVTAEIINANAYNFKMKWRNIVGGSRIHCSDNEYETNRNLSVLFGLSLSEIKENINILNFSYHKQNCLGVNGFSSLASLFFLLNNNIKYCVLRNFENIFSQPTSSYHNDIDLLVEHKNFIIYLTGASPVYPDYYRVLHTITIAHKKNFFDFRYLGDNYYDYKWEKNILNHRIFQENTFFIPNQQNHFFCLLYHALIQKKAIAPDYITRLNSYSNQTINQDLDLPSTAKSLEILDKFISQNDYSYTKPTDASVYFNHQNIKQTQSYQQFGIPLKNSYALDDKGNIYYTSIFTKDGIFIKKASQEILENEFRFLEQLKESSSFPKIIRYSSNKLEITSVPGITLQTFIGTHQKFSLNQQKKFLIGIINILESLYSNRIIHRDFTPSNILIDTENDECNVHLIDFGWAIQYEEEASAIEPIGLGEIYRHPKYFSDAYAFAQILKIHFSSYPYLYNSAKIFEKIALTQHPDINDLEEVHQFVSKKISPVTLVQFHSIDFLKKTQSIIITMWRKAIYPLHFRQWITNLHNAIKQ